MKEIPLAQGKVALIDDEDYHLSKSYHWCHTKTKRSGMGYAVAAAKQGNRWTTVRLHRIVMGLQKGDQRKVDHINGNSLDNRRCNLRVCSNSENLRNSSVHRDNKTGLKGVSRSKRADGVKFRARINDGERDIHLGYFESAPEAAEAYNKAAIDIFGVFANLNECQPITRT